MVALMLCANCPKVADYFEDDPGANPVPYCRTCLPKHQKHRAAAGHFSLPKTVRKRTAKTP